MSKPPKGLDRFVTPEAKTLTAPPKDLDELTERMQKLIGPFVGSAITPETLHSVQGKIYNLVHEYAKAGGRMDPDFVSPEDVLNAAKAQLRQLRSTFYGKHAEAGVELKKDTSKTLNIELVEYITDKLLEFGRDLQEFDQYMRRHPLGFRVDVTSKPYVGQIQVDINTIYLAARAFMSNVLSLEQLIVEGGLFNKPEVGPETKLTRQQLKDALVSPLEQWDHQTLLEFAKTALNDHYDGMDIHELEQAYLDFKIKRMQ